MHRMQIRDESRILSDIEVFCDNFQRLKAPRAIRLKDGHISRVPLDKIKPDDNILGVYNSRLETFDKHRMVCDILEAMDEARGRV